MRVAQALEQISRRLQQADIVYGHGTDNSHDEAAWILAYILGRGADLSQADANATLTGEQERQLDEITRRRIREREPTAYILGESWFAGLRFKVSRDTLIPRSPIAELISEGFSPWVEQPGTALDLCTGSGCIAVAMAVYMPALTVDAVDISSAALAVAAENVALHRLEQRVRLLQSDLFTALDGRRYDLIVSNPPYVEAARWQRLPQEYLAEPRLGLVAGRRGLDLVLKILLSAPDYLNPSGVLICEVGESRERLLEALPRVPLIWLSFQFGGEGVFLISRQELLAAREQIEQLMEAGDVG